MNESNKDISVRASNVAARELQSLLTGDGGVNYTPDDLGSQFSAGVESRAIINNARNNLDTRGVEVYGHDGWAELTKAQKDAFRISALSWGDFKGYHDKASNVAVSNESRLPSSGAVDHYLQPTLTDGIEAYDARNLINSKVATTVVNVGMARQDDFAEMFYETEVLPPDEGNVVFSVESTFVMTDFMHKGNGYGGVAKNFGGVNLIDALVNPEVLRDAATKIVPLYSKTNPAFTPEVEPFKDPQTQVETGALKFNTPIGLLAISQDDVLNPHQLYDVTDQLDHDVRVERVFLKVTRKGKSDIIPILTKNIPGANFHTSPMSKSASRDLTLAFGSQSLAIRGNTLNVAGVPAETLEYLRDPTRQDWVVYLDLNLGGTVNLETGNIRVNDSKVQLHEVWTETLQSNGMTIPTKVTNAADLNMLNAEFDSLELVGWYPQAQRTNFNRRTRGLLIRSDVFTESYTIPMGPPISVLSPVVDTETLVDLEGPILANRIRNSQNALVKLKEFGDQLKQFPNANDVHSPRPEIEGVGRYIMRPYYAEETLDFREIVDTLRSTDKLEDLNMALIAVIRSLVTKAWTQSNYGPAWQAMGIEGKPIVNIGCNAEIASYLNIKGDDRLMGEYFTARVGMTYNREIGDTIYINFDTKSKNVCFKSGNFYYIPEIVSTLPKTTNGGQSVQLTVQNRNLHLNHAPIQIRLNVLGLDEVLRKKVPLRANVKSVDSHPTGVVASTVVAGAPTPPTNPL